MNPARITLLPSGETEFAFVRGKRWFLIRATPEFLSIPGAEEQIRDQAKRELTPWYRR